MKPKISAVGSGESDSINFICFHDIIANNMITAEIDRYYFPVEKPLNVLGKQENFGITSMVLTQFMSTGLTEQFFKMCK